MKTFDPLDITSQRLHQVMLGAIAPRPIAFASTIDAEGQANLAPFSFFNAFGVNPSTLIFSPARRNRDNTTKHTFENIKIIPEVVINVVNWEMVEQVNLASNEYPDGVNEFVKAGFGMQPSEKVRPFRVAESPVQFECKVRQVVETGGEAGSANLVICEILLIHVSEKVLDASGLIDPEKIRLVGRMGGDYYIKAFGPGLFKVAKPSDPPGIGMDRLPYEVLHSDVLTGNDLGRLGSLKVLPAEEDIAKARQNEDLKIILSKFQGDAGRIGIEKHLLARELIEKGHNHEALSLLMT